MANSIIQHNCVNRASVQGSSPAHGRVGVNPEHRQIVIKRSGNSSENLKIGTLNIGTLRGRSGEVVETLERRNLDICCVQEVRWRGASARMLTGKSSQYKLFWVGHDSGHGGVGVLVAARWVEHIIDVKRVDDRLMMVKFLVGKKAIAVVSTYAPQQGLSDAAKDQFYTKLTQLVSKFDDNDMVVIAGDLNGHVGKASNGYEGIHGGFGYGSRNVEGERILEFGAALDMAVCNTCFEKRDSHLCTYTSGGFSTQIDYILVRTKDRKFVRDVKVIPGEEVATQHHILVSTITVQSRVENKKPFVPKRKVWLLKEQQEKESFVTEFNEASTNRNENGSVEDLWNSLKVDLLGAADRTCGWTSGPPRHQVTWWWNNNVDLRIKRKRDLWKEWKKKGGSKEAYLEAKRDARRAVYYAKRIAEETRFRNVIGREDHRQEVFKIARQMKASQQDVVGDKCVRNDNGKLAVTDGEKLKAWKEHYQRLLNEEFPWKKEDLDIAQPVIGPCPEIDKESVRTALSKMKNGKASGTSGVVAEMLLAADDKGIERLTNLFVFHVF